MEWKDIINRNFSRKAEILVATEITIVLLVRIEDVDAGILKAALVIAGLIGVIGLIVQGILDWRHPKAPPCFAVSTWMNPGGADPVGSVVEENQHATKDNAPKAVDVAPFDMKHPPENKSPAGQA